METTLSVHRVSAAGFAQCRVEDATSNNSLSLSQNNNVTMIIPRHQLLDSQSNYFIGNSHSSPHKPILNLGQEIGVSDCVSDFRCTSHYARLWLAALAQPKST